jgi:chemotaxis regulatin CheY-phosphate phosphatase CheZ
MNEPKSLISVFDKLNDLKTLFRFGEKIVPIIQSLVEFMKEIIPLLENINTSIADSTNKMPIASNQINDVTNATELATTQILDLVDDISNALAAIEGALVIEKDKQKKVEELVDFVGAALPQTGEVKEKFDELVALARDRQTFENTIQLIEAIREDTYKITLALQVQDITAQQLAAVNHLISSVHNRLTLLVADIANSDLREELSGNGFDVPEGAHFDPNASYTKNQGRQEEVDALVRENNLSK